MENIAHKKEAHLEECNRKIKQGQQTQLERIQSTENLN